MHVNDVWILGAGKFGLKAVERIKQKQRQQAAEIQADIEVDKALREDELDRRLKAAGITNEATAKQVLERIKDKK